MLNFKFFKALKSKSVMFKVTSVAVIASIIASVVVTGVFASGGDPLVANYPLLEEFSMGSEPEGTYWQYSVKDFTAKAGFKTSDESFKAPELVSNASGNALQWDAVDTADSYYLIIFDSAGNKFAEYTTQSLNQAVIGMSENISYRAQVQAFSGTTLLKASMVRVFTVSVISATPDATSWSPIKDVTGATTAISGTPTLPSATNPEFSFGFKDYGSANSVTENCNTLTDYTNSKGTILGKYLKVGTNNDYYRYDAKTITVRIDGSDGMDFGFTAPVDGTYYFSADVTTLDSESSFKADKLEFRVTKESNCVRSALTDTVSITAAEKTATPEITKDVGVVKVELKSGESLHFEAFADDVCIFNIGVPTVSYLQVSENAEDEERSTTYLYTDFNFRAAYGDQKELERTGLTVAKNNPWRMAYFAAPATDGSTSFVYSSSLSKNKHLAEYSQGQSGNSVFRNTHNGTEESRFYLKANYGMAFEFTMPEDGDLTLNIANANATYASRNCKYRWRINGVAQEIVQKSGDTAATGGWYSAANKIQTASFENLKAGDVVSYEIYFTSGSGFATVSAPAAIVTSSYTPETNQNSEYIYEYAQNGYKFFEGETFACNDFDSSLNTYTYSGKENKYIFSKSEVKATLTDNALYASGVSLKFTPNVTGLYDLTHRLVVLENSANVNSTVYYRVVEQTDSGDKLIYPQSGWAEIKTSAATPTPQMDLEPVLATLTAGTAVRIEAYADIEGDGSLTVSLGNPCFTYTETGETSIGKQTVFVSSDHFAGVQYNEAMATYYEQAGRFKFRMLEVSGDNAVSVLPAKFNPSWSKGSVYTTYDQSLGFWYDKTETTPKEEIFLYKTADTYGEEIVFVSPSAGSLNLNSTLTVKNDAKVKVRVLKGDTVIWPQNGSWLTTGGTTVDVNVKVEAGDQIKLQLITPDGDLVQGKYNPIVTMLETDYVNSAAGDKFSPLWERPYNAKNYNGSFIAPKNTVFDFNMVNLSDSSVIDTDYFYSNENNRLGSSNIEKSGYQFLSDELGFLFADTNYGMQYVFTAPCDGIYDISSALRIIAGNGSVIFGIKSESTVLCPDTVLSGTVGAEKLIDAISVELKKGDTVTVTATPTETDGNLVLSLGEPTFIKLSKTERLGADTLYVYTPYGFTAFEPERSGAYIDMTRRFGYTFEDLNASVLTLDSFDSATGKILHTTSGNYFTVSDSNIAITFVNDSTAKITFISPFEDTASLSFAANLISGAAEYRVTLNGQAVTVNGSEWNTAITDDIVMKSANIDLKAGDKAVLEVKGTAGTVVNLGDMAYSFAVRLTDYTAQDEAYSAVGCNPFDSIEYTGKYNYDDAEYWNYGIIDVTDVTNIKQLETDYYDSAAGGRLYNKDLGTGYYITDKVSAELINTQNSKTGISLGFIAPRTDTFVFGSALDIDTAVTTADIYVRITLNGETVWPQDSAWHKASLSSESTAITVPAYEYSAVAGDEIRLEVYAENIVTNGSKVQTVKLNLGIPQVYTERTTAILNDDITADIHYQTKGYQYITDSFTGYSIPMEKRWNIETAVFTENGYTVEYPDYYNSATSEFSFQNGTAYPVYNAKASTAVLTASSIEPIGVSLRLKSITDATTFYECIPTITNTSLSEDVKVYFRIIRTPSEESDKQYDVIWPVNSEWETLTSSNRTSAASMAQLSLSAGDHVIAQVYATGDGGETVNISWNPTAIAAERYAESASKYALEGGYTPYYQISPFWSYEYAINRDDAEYRQLETFNSSPSWLDWVSSQKNYIDIGESIFYIDNVDSEKGRFDTMPILSAKFTAPANGYYSTQKNMKASIIATTVTEDIKAVDIRILLNGEKIWPVDSDWTTVQLGTTVSEYFEKIKLSKGDELRFEVTPNGQLAVGSKFKFRWRVGLDYTAYDNVYTKTNDIYNMLTADMYSYFKSLAASGEFDPDFSANKLLSEQLKALRDQVDDQETTGQEEINDDALEPEEDSDSTKTIVKKRKVTYITVGLPTWAIVLIVVGCVVAVAAVVTVLIILKKKGIIKSRKKQKEES